MSYLNRRISFKHQSWLIVLTPFIWLIRTTCNCITQCKFKHKDLCASDAHGADNIVPILVTSRKHQCMHTCVISKTMTCPNPKPYQKNFKFNAPTSNPFSQYLTFQIDVGRRPCKKGYLLSTVFYVAIDNFVVILSHDLIFLPNMYIIFKITQNKLKRAQIAHDWLKVTHNWKWTSSSQTK